MRNELSVGRTLGALLLVQMAVGIWINFGLLAPVFEPPGFLHNAAEHPVRIGLSALLGIGGSGLSLLAMSLLWPWVSKAGPVLARVYAAVVVASFVGALIEQGAVLSMLSLSENFQRAGTDAEALYQGLRGVVAAQRNWAHYIHLLISGAGLLVMHALLFRGRCLPRLLTGFGMLAALLQMYSVAQPLLGGEVVMPLLAPLALSELLLALWLLARGLAPISPPADARAASVASAGQRLG
ncbi:DUF4386 family protein [Aquimonas sp.]|jgi:hypothetical protein|uniref:DUF4386 family protein n=1 Tax=Aquimonas sp. TaxID=1872588 RepID=UPI0037BF338F